MEVEHQLRCKFCRTFENDFPDYQTFILIIPTLSLVNTPEANERGCTEKQLFIESLEVLGIE